jgi:hypothetical protein
MSLFVPRRCFARFGFLVILFEGDFAPVQGSDKFSAWTCIQFENRNAVRARKKGTHIYTHTHTKQKLACMRTCD